MGLEMDVGPVPIVGTGPDLGRIVSLLDLLQLLSIDAAASSLL